MTFSDKSGEFYRLWGRPVYNTRYQAELVHRKSDRADKGLFLIMLSSQKKFSIFFLDECSSSYRIYTYIYMYETVCIIPMKQALYFQEIDMEFSKERLSNLTLKI